MNKKLILAFVLGLCVIPVAGFIFLFAGGMPVATKSHPLPLERFAAGVALHAATRGADKLKAPFAASQAHLVAGAKVFHQNCAVCHGLPGQKATFIAKGMFPPPPQLYQPDEDVADDPVGETYWKVKNGIRITGMPGFGGNLSRTQMWEVSLLLTKGDHLSAPVKQALTSGS